MELLTILYALLAAITGVTAGERAAGPARVAVAASAVAEAAVDASAPRAAQWPLPVASRVAVTRAPPVIAPDLPRRFAMGAFAPLRE